MNVFAVSKSPTVCARYLDDKRLCKMIVETAQMLSVAGYGPYKITHKNHPCTIWVSFWVEWAIALELALCTEYTFRFRKTHSTYAKLMCHAAFKRVAKRVRKRGFLMPNEWPKSYNKKFKNKRMHSHKAYRETMVLKWKRDKRSPRWTRRKPPAVAPKRAVHIQVK